MSSKQVDDGFNIEVELFALLQDLKEAFLIGVMNFTVGGDFFGDFFDVQEYRSPWKFTYWVDQILNLDDMVPAFTWQPSSAQKADSFTKRGASSFVVFVRDIQPP